MATLKQGRLFLIFISIFLAFALCDDLCAEPIELEEITVHGEGVENEEAPPDLTASSTEIEMDPYRGRVISVAEILDQAVGVRIQQFGGLEDFATVAIRGSSGEQVQVYLDGVSLNQAAGGAVDLSTIPADLIESITIYRSQAPARFDTSTIGGVVDIKTRRPLKKRRTEIHNTYGSLNSYEGVVFHSQSFKKTRLLISYQHSRSDGDFSFLDNNGTPANPNDDQVVTRSNNEFAKNYLLFRLYQPITSKINFEFYNNFFREDRGIPGLGTLKSDEADLSTTRNLTQLNINLIDIGPGNQCLRINPFLSFNKSQFTDRLGEIGLGMQDNDDDTYLYGTKINSDFFIGSFQHLTFVTTYTGEQFRPENFLSIQRTGQASVRNRISLSVEDELSFFNDRFILNPMIRFEMIFNDLTGADPSQSLLATPNNANDYPISGKIGSRVEIIDNLQATANFGRGYRIPTFLELFGDRGATVGNPNLKPEESINFDVGVQWHPGRYQIGANYFEHHTKNLIQFLQTSQFTAQARNLASATIRGFEIEGYAIIGKGKGVRGKGKEVQFELTANYTFQWAKDTSRRTGFDGKFLPGRPRHQVHAALNLTYRWIKFFTDFDFIDDNFLDSLNTIKVTRRSLLGLGFTLSPWKWIEAGFEAKNILNQQIEDVVGFPVPGRLFFGKVGIMI